MIEGGGAGDLSLDLYKLTNHQSAIFFGQYFRAGFLAFRQRGVAVDSTPLKYSLSSAPGPKLSEYVHNMGVDPRGGESIA